MESFVLLGDSLFERASSQDKDRTGQIIGSLQPRLANAYMCRLDVVNRGFSGYNTSQILALLRSTQHPSAYLPAKRTFVVVLLGANDARLPDTPGGPQQHVPLEIYKQNMEQIVTEPQGTKHIILVTPPPVDERMMMEADGAKDPELAGVPRRKASVTGEYAGAVRDLGGELSGKGVKVLDLWSKMIAFARNGEEDSEQSTLPGARDAPVNERLQSCLIDGLHFSRKGYDLFYDELMACIGEHWPEELPDRMPMATPAWDDQDKWTAEGGLRKSSL